MSFMYILQCSDNTYYTGSTHDLQLRFWQHQCSEGAKYTSKRQPVELVYFEEYSRIDQAFIREKQVQGWCRKKKEALINGELKDLHFLSECKNTSHFTSLQSISPDEAINNQLHTSAPLSVEVR